MSQVGDHVTALPLFLGPKETPEGEAGHAFWEMALLERRIVPYHLYRRARGDLECVSRECQNPAHAR